MTSPGERLAPARDALREGRVADALARLDDAGDAGPDGLLLRALLLRLLDRPGVGALVDEATADGDPERLVRAARIVGWGVGFAHTVRAPRRSTPEELAHAERLIARAAAAAPGGPTVLRARCELEQLLGREAEAIATLEALAAATPDDVRVRLQLARILLGHRDAERAAPHADAAVRLAPGRPDTTGAWAAVAVALGRSDAPDAIDAWAAAAPEAWGQVSACWLDVGRPDRAEAVVAAAPACAARDGWQARLALWRGDLPTARRLAATAPGHVARVVEAGVAVLEGRAGDAVGSLRSGGDHDPFLPIDEVQAWLSDAERRAGDLAAARRDADRARTAATDYSLAAHLLQVLAILDAQQVVTEAPDPWIWRPLAEKLGDLADGALDAATVAEARALAARALDRLGGNRSSTPTKVVDGRLVAVRHPPHPRHEARAVQHLLRTRTIDEVDAAFEALHRRLPDAPNTLTYHGEALVWVGRYEASIPRFEQAIRLDRQTVWAWIGLGAARMLLGDDDAALVTWRDGEAAVRYRGPTLDVYEAELWWRRGEPDRAVPLLDGALARKPIRFASWALRALVEHDLHGSARPATLVAEQLRARGPGLWLDAAAAGGSSDPVEVLRASLSLMRGNRSSTLACWPVGERCRFLRWQALLRPAAVFGAGDR